MIVGLAEPERVDIEPPSQRPGPLFEALYDTCFGDPPLDLEPMLLKIWDGLA